MNYIDLIVCLTLAIAIFNGWRQGVIMQICSILSIFFGVWFGVRYGATVGEWLHIGDEYSSVGGFLVVVVLMVIIIGVISQLVRRIFKFAGLGPMDTIIGVGLSICKFALILSLLFGAFDSLNKEFDIVNKKTIAGSKLYKPVIKISDLIFPALDWTKKQINSGIEKL